MSDEDEADGKEPRHGPREEPRALPWAERSQSFRLLLGCFLQPEGLGALSPGQRPGLAGSLLDHFFPSAARSPAITTSRNSRALCAKASTPSGLSGLGTSGAK